MKKVKSTGFAGYTAEEIEAAGKDDLQVKQKDLNLQKVIPFDVLLNSRIGIDRTDPLRQYEIRTTLT
jgi:hypothetical protein